MTSRDSDDWFEVFEVAPGLFVFHEPGHYEATNAALALGPGGAVLIDTGCGIGDLRAAVEAVTDMPVSVVNTHTHPDHLGSNRQFAEIAMFDHPSGRRVAENGIPREVLEAEILADGLVTEPWPRGFDPAGFALPPFEVSRWLTDGERVALGGTEFEVIHTPGEAPDHICLLDRTRRVLFCGDILLHGPVWTHLEGGSLRDLIASYRRLMRHYDDFDHLVPGHNEPWLDKDLLPEALEAAERVAAGRAAFRERIDRWHRPVRVYPFGRFSIWTNG